MSEILFPVTATLRYGSNKQKKKEGGWGGAEKERVRKRKALKAPPTDPTVKSAHK